MTSEWHVYGCRRCSTLFLRQPDPDQQTTMCPACKLQHALESLKVLASADRRESAVEKRGELLRERSDVDAAGFYSFGRDG